LAGAGGDGDNRSSDDDRTVGVTDRPSTDAPGTPMSGCQLEECMPNRRDVVEEEQLWKSQ